MADVDVLRKFTDKELHEFIESRKTEELIPNIEKKIKIVSKLIEDAKELDKYSYCDDVREYGHEPSVVGFLTNQLDILKMDKGFALEKIIK